MQISGYDLIGDVHGQAAILIDLLRRLGYELRSGGWRHPERQALFVGDYIDRGPAIRETLRLVRAMVEHGAAVALCGNHELSALQHATPDGRGGWLRPHTPRNSLMHSATDAEFAGRAGEWREWLRWFQTLPLYFESPGLRAIHACWDEAHLAQLAGRRFLDDALLHASVGEGPAAAAVNTLLKGREVLLPPGHETLGRTGVKYREMRVRWWQDGRGRTYREACINREPGPDLVIGQEFQALLTPIDSADARPVFFGHYWLPPEPPAPLAPRMVCLDYSVAGGGPLVAYRWDGETELRAEKFVYDPRRLPPGAEHRQPVAVAIC